MSDEINRLVRCFRAVFPDLPEDAVQTASVDTLARWDSLAMVTLISLVESEFGLQLDPLEVAECDSFAALRSHLRNQGLLL